MDAGATVPRHDCLPCTNIIFFSSHTSQSCLSCICRAWLTVPMRALSCAALKACATSCPIYSGSHEVILFFTALFKHQREESVGGQVEESRGNAQEAGRQRPPRGAGVWAETRRSSHEVLFFYVTVSLLISFSLKIQWWTNRGTPNVFILQIQVGRAGQIVGPSERSRLQRDEGERCVLLSISQICCDRFPVVITLHCQFVNAHCSL